LGKWKMRGGKGTENLKLIKGDRQGGQNSTEKQELRPFHREIGPKAKERVIKEKGSRKRVETSHGLLLSAARKIDERQIEKKKKKGLR